MDEDRSTELPLPGPVRPPDRSREWELSAWAVLAVIVLGLFTLTQLAPAPEKSAMSDGGAELRFQGRYVLGVTTLAGRLGEGFAANFTTQLEAQLRSQAGTPVQRLCMVPVIAEVAGPEQALEDIAALSQESGLSDEDEADLALLAQLYGDGGELDIVARQGLAERRGWFGRLALTHGRDPEDPERQALLGESTRAAAVMIVLVIGVAGAGMTGLVLLVVGFLMFREGRLRLAYHPGCVSSEGSPVSIASRLPLLETVVVFILATLAAGLVAALVLDVTGSQAIALGATLLAVPAVFWPLVRGVSASELREAYGWHRGTGLWREVGCGLLGYVAGAPLLILGILMSAMLAAVSGEQAHHPLIDGISEAGVGGTLIIFLVACVSAPLVEETVFRGGFYHYLRARLGMVASALAIAAVFAFIHPQGLLGVPPLVALATVLALIREWRGSLVASIAVHAVHNALATTVILIILS